MKPNAIQKRLEELNLALAEAQRNPAANVLYISDIEACIFNCETKLNKMRLHGIAL